MTNATSEAPQSGAVFWRLYMLGWVGLAGAALIYLSAAVLQPDLLKPLVPQATAQADAAQDVVSTKLETLERSLNSLENKIASVESKVQEVATQAATPSAAKPTEPEDKIASAPAIPPVEPAEGAVPDKPVVVAQGKLPPLPARAPERRQIASAQTQDGQEPAIPVVILNGVAAAGIATGSVDRPKVPEPALKPTAIAKKLPEIVKAEPTVKQIPPGTAIAFGKPTVEAAQNLSSTKSIVVSVAGSVEKLRSDWDLLTARHPQLLGKLQPRYDIMAANGPFRLLAGPLTSRTEANQLCTVLQLQGVTCDVEDNFLGNAL